VSDTNSMLDKALKQMKAMNYAIALRMTLIKMLDECETLEKQGVNVAELVNLIRVANDYTLYIRDTQDELPESI
jgi:hypothetical protein